DAAEALQSVEQLVAAGMPGADTAAAIRGLLDDGRFEIRTEPDPEPETATEPAPAPEPAPEPVSDLVGNGDVDAVQEVDAVAEAPAPVGGPLDPTPAEVAHPLELGAERGLDLVDEPAVGDHDDMGDVAIDPRSFLGD